MSAAVYDATFDGGIGVRQLFVHDRGEYFVRLRATDRPAIYKKCGRAARAQCGRIGHVGGDRGCNGICIAECVELAQVDAVLARDRFERGFVERFLFGKQRVVQRPKFPLTLREARAGALPALRSGEMAADCLSKRGEASSPYTLSKFVRAWARRARNRDTENRRIRRW